MIDLIKLRHHLHKFPELSNMEFDTSNLICDIFEDFKPNEIIELGTTSRAFVFNSGKAGKTIMFRADLDALPIQEENMEIDYSSIKPDIAHLCGHDGHIAMLVGLGEKISQNRPKTGEVVLLFQQAEESEQGARDVVSHQNFKKIEPDYIYAIHNIPKFEKGSLIFKHGSMAAASKGMIIKLEGLTSHAAEPERGISPASAIAKIIQQVELLQKNNRIFSDLILLTIIHIEMGEIAFGTSPGYAEIRITLRAFENDDMTFLTNELESIIKSIATDEHLDFDISYCEEFPAVVNSISAIGYVEKVMKKLNLQKEYLNKPMKWSEDFSYFTQKYEGALIGLGSGKEQPALHNSNYNFPDDILEIGVEFLFGIYQEFGT